MDGRLYGSPRGAFAAALVLLTLFLVASLGPASALREDPRALDSMGPVIASVAVVPNPVMPGIVAVRATAYDLDSYVVGAEFFIDNDIGNSTLMTLEDGVPGYYENLIWYGKYGSFPQGVHTLYVHAIDSALPANWGSWRSTIFLVANASTTGPFVDSVSVFPADLSLGADLTVQATLRDPFNQSFVERAEFFVDDLGADGTGVPLLVASPGYTAEAVWTGALDVAPGQHTVYVHGMNDRNVWGSPSAGTFTLRAPHLSFTFLVDRLEAPPGELVQYAVAFENRGNENAASVWFDVTLPSEAAYVSDDADAQTTFAGKDVSASPLHFEFSDVPVGACNFTIGARVSEAATDETPLEAIAAMDYTNAGGWDFDVASANASSTVVAQELYLDFSAEGSALAGDTVDLTVQLRNVGRRSIQTVDVILAESARTSVVSDTAVAQGWTKLAPRSWRFEGLPPGVHSFRATERIASSVVDGSQVFRSVEATYLSRLGVRTILRGDAEVLVRRPVLTIDLGSEEPEVTEGGRVALAIRLANLGSVAAMDARLSLVLPPDLEFVGGDAPTRVNGGTLTWEFSSIGPGVLPAAVDLILEAPEAGSFLLRFELAYRASSGGLELGPAVASTAVLVHPSPPPPTLLIVSAVAVVATIGTGAYAATERGKSGFLLFLVPLYTRLRKEKVLDHETRGMIRGYIIANPGDHYNAIKETLELPNGTLAYHLSVLEKERIVRSVKDGKFRRFYPFEMRVPMGGQPTKIQRVILELIRANPGLTLRGASDLLGLTPSTVSYHLDRLRELNRVEMRREGISKHMYIRDRADDLAKI